MREEYEQIDRSQWIGLKAVEEYARRAVEAGRKVWNGRSILPGAYDKLPVEWLAEDAKILTDSHKFAGINFHIICNCAEGRVSVFGTTDSLEISLISPTMKKIAIEAQLCPGDKHLVRRVVCYPVYRADYEQFKRIPQRLVEAFDALEEAMQRDNMLNSLDEIRRNANMSNRSRAISVSRFCEPTSSF